jgi:HPt (histidine-containing phosphotransfer) domain-containing protein
MARNQRMRRPEPLIMGENREIPVDVAADRPGAAVDLSHLEGQTGGDDRLAREVLGLFVTRVAADFERLKSATDPAGRHAAAHTIVGSARAIGATAVAAIASEIAEARAADADGIEALGEAIAEARRFVLAHLGG